MTTLVLVAPSGHHYPLSQSEAARFLGAFAVEYASMRLRRGGEQYEIQTVPAVQEATR